MDKQPDQADPSKQAKDDRENDPNRAAKSMIDKIAERTERGGQDHRTGATRADQPGDRAA